MIGVGWHEFGKPLPEVNTEVHGIAASDEAIDLATDRGIYRSIDNGEKWTLVAEIFQPTSRQGHWCATLWTRHRFMPALASYHIANFGNDRQASGPHWRMSVSRA